MAGPVCSPQATSRPGPRPPARRSAARWTGAGLSRCRPGAGSGPRRGKPEGFSDLAHGSTGTGHRHLSWGGVNAIQASVPGPGRLMAALLTTDPRGWPLPVKQGVRFRRNGVSVSGETGCPKPVKSAHGRVSGDTCVQWGAMVGPSRRDGVAAANPQHAGRCATRAAASCPGMPPGQPSRSRCPAGWYPRWLATPRWRTRYVGRGTSSAVVTCCEIGCRAVRASPRRRACAPALPASSANRTPRAEADVVPPLAWVVVPDSSSTATGAYPLVDHIADTVCAILERHSAAELPSTRH